MPETPIIAFYNVMLTTDDRLLKKAGRNAKALKVPVENPLQWLLEQDDYQASARWSGAGWLRRISLISF